MADFCRRMSWFAVLALSACGASSAVSPELVCQRRIAQALDGSGDAQEPGEAFVRDAARWRALDRTGCSGSQVAAIDQLARAAARLADLAHQNEEVGRTEPNSKRHMAAFQAFNDALIAYEDLFEAEKRKPREVAAD